MLEHDLRTLGEKITRLRIARDLKQSELAYEAGISERTLQRMEAGEVVKSDGLLKVIAYLGKLDAMLGAIDTPAFSPYELANSATRGGAPPRSRVRRSRKQAPAKDNTTEKVLWPEDKA